MLSNTDNSEQPDSRQPGYQVPSPGTVGQSSDVNENDVRKEEQPGDWPRSFHIWLIKGQDQYHLGAYSTSQPQVFTPEGAPRCALHLRGTFVSLVLGVRATGQASLHFRKLYIAGNHLSPRQTRLGNLPVFRYLRCFHDNYPHLLEAPSLFCLCITSIQVSPTPPSTVHHFCRPIYV